MQAVPLCIRYQSHIPHASEVFPLLGFAYMHAYGVHAIRTRLLIIHLSHDVKVRSIHALSDARESVDGQYVCADISQPGVYFGALLTRSYSEPDTAAASMSAQYAFSIIFYLLALAAGIAQTVRVVRMNEQLMPVKTVILAISLLYAACTCPSALFITSFLIVI